MEGTSVVPAQAGIHSGICRRGAPGQTGAVGCGWAGPGAAVRVSLTITGARCTLGVDGLVILQSLQTERDWEIMVESVGTAEARRPWRRRPAADWQTPLRVAEALGSLELGRPQKHEGLKLYPLFRGRGQATVEPDYALLTEAIESGDAEVVEATEGGVVQELRLLNRGSRPLLALDGEELVGAMQNRTLSVSLLAAAASTLTIPVTCVEAGRWGYGIDDDEPGGDSRAFQASARMQHPSARRVRMESVSEALRTRRTREAGQSEVWEEIGALSDDLETHSATAALHDVYERHETSLEEYLEAFPAIDDQVGVVAALDGRVRGLELFESAAVYRRQSSRIAGAWALETMRLRRRRERQGRRLRRSREVSRRDAARFIARLAVASCEDHASVGLGRDLRLSGSKLTGAALVSEDRVLHLCAFRGRNGGASRNRRGG